MSEKTVVTVREKRVIVYDFKRPDKFSKEQIRTVAIIHETFARLLTTQLMPLLGCPVDIHVASVDQCTYDEYIRSMSTPTCFSVIAMEPLRGTGILEMDPGLSFLLLEILCGGKAEGALPTKDWRGARRFDPDAGASAIVPRDFTEAEHAIMSDVLARCMDGFKHAWSTVIDMRPRVSSIETNPLFAQIVPPDELVILVALGVKVGEREGAISVAIPFLTIEPVARKLSAQYWYSTVRPRMDERSLKEGFDRYSGIGLGAELCAEGPAISLRAIGSLKKGRLLPLPVPAEGKAFIRMGGAAVLGLRVQNDARRRPLRFAVDAAAGPSLDGDASAANEESERIEASLKKSLFESQSGFAQGIADIKQGIGELRARQERLEESIALGGGAETEELAGAEAADEPFAYLGVLRPETTAGIMQKEGPQLIALVSSHMDAKAASSLLAMLPAEIQAEVAKRIARMGNINAGVIEILDGVFKRIVSDIPRSAVRVSGGVEKIIDILNLAERSVERNVVGSMERSDPELAEEIKSLMFVFEDIVLIDARQVELVLARVDRDALLKAMKAIPDEVRDFLWGCVKDGERAALKEAFDRMGRVRLHDVEEAQQRIVALIREMNENGEIVVARPEELAN